MRKLLFAFIPLLLIASLFLGCNNNNVKGRNLVVHGGYFYMDSSLFVLSAADMSYARHPRGLWEWRMRQLHALGVNTIRVRVPWMLHEQNEGVFDFTGEKDIKAFCRLARKNDLLVWLHIGPYVDEHIDMGGMPWWLLKYDSLQPRCNDRLFMQKTGRFYRALSEQLAGEKIQDGGALALVQIEEPCGLSGNVKEYLSALRDTAIAAGFDNLQFTVAARKENITSVAIDKALIAVDIDDKQHATNHFSAIKKLNPSAPIICYDIERNCMHMWGEESGIRNWDKSYMRLFEVLYAGGSVAINALNGGTSFGHLAGATVKNGIYRPYSTSYDNNSIIKENGETDEHFYDISKTIKTYTTQFGNVDIEDIPYRNYAVLKELSLAHSASLFDELPEPLISERPLGMEKCNVGYGAVLYAVSLPKLQGGSKIRLNGIRDYAQLFIGNKRFAEFGRSDTIAEALLPETVIGDTLYILVDAMGRAADASGYKDYKGLIGDVVLLDSDGKRIELKEWLNYPLAAEYSFVSSLNYSDRERTVSPACYRAEFDKPSDGDISLYLKGFTRGEVWINGHSLGRYMSVGSQKTLYLPECWLKDTGNEIIILDWVGAKNPAVRGIEVDVL